MLASFMRFWDVGLPFPPRSVSFCPALVLTKCFSKRSYASDYIGFGAILIAYLVVGLPRKPPSAPPPCTTD
jgi:hypothetical protein